MVHAQNAFVADAAVMGPVGFDALTALAIARSPIVRSHHQHRVVAELFAHLLSRDILTSGK